MSQLLPGAVEVVVIAEEGVTLNDPNHRSLGTIAMGDSAIISESYLPYLREQGLVCLLSELESLDTKSIESQLGAMFSEVDDDDQEKSGDDTPAESPVESEPTTRRKGGRPRAS